jgi:peptidoglycan LD-endopeptidase LytH
MNELPPQSKVISNVVFYLFSHLFLIIFLSFSLPAQAQDSLQIYTEQFNQLYKKIRDNTLLPDSAKSQFQSIISKIREFYPDSLAKDTTQWVFPLRGYNASYLGGKEGSGYISGTYNYFDGVKSTGHPAHDIFINDRNQDCLDDNTGLSVEVLSVAAGIVIATETEWQATSPLRGGLYIWIYNAHLEALFYYAHQQKIEIKVGDWVKRGQKIGEVGRTGRNAFKKRSPTHLHFMQMKIENKLPIPQNPYQFLLKAEMIK